MKHNILLNIKYILSALGDKSQDVLSYMSDDSITKLSNIHDKGLNDYVDIHETLQTCLKYLKQEKENLENDSNNQTTSAFLSNKTLTENQESIENDMFELDNENLFESDDVSEELNTVENNEHTKDSDDIKNETTQVKDLDESKINYKLIANRLKKESLQKKSFFIQNLDKDEQVSLFKYFSDKEKIDILSNKVHINKFTDKIFKTLYSQYYFSNHATEALDENDSEDQNNDLVDQEYQEININDENNNDYNEDIVMSELSLS